jgi:transposase
LHEKGLGVVAISRQVGLSRKTVSTYLQWKQAPELVTQGSIVDAYMPYLQQRWSAGVHNALILWQELQEQGYKGSYPTVARAVAPLRETLGAKGKTQARATKYKQAKFLASELAEPARLRPKVALRKAVGLVMKARTALNTEEDELVQSLLTQHPQLLEAYPLVQTFASMVRERRGAELGDWLAKVEASDVTALRRFATGLRQDQAAVTAGLSEIYSNGQVEGTVNKLKVLKREMYGRASFNLLKNRLLNAA